jgi:hypothetical protein
MSTGSVATGSIYNELQQYFQTRNSDQKALGTAIKSGDLAAAQTDYNAIQTLGKSGPFSTGNAYSITQREQDFTAVGQALQSGDLAGAQQAFTDLQDTFKKTGTTVQHQADQNPAVVVNIGGSGTLGSGSGSAAAGATGSTAANGAEIVLNLGTLTPGEQITIGVNSGANGAEQLTVGIANPTATTTPAPETASAATAATGSTAAAASTPATASTAAAASAAATNGSEVTLNLGTVTAGEQITIGVSSGTNGGEQLTVGTTQTGQTPEQITLNLNQSTNQQILLNLFNSTAASTTTPGSAVNVSA